MKFPGSPILCLTVAAFGIPAVMFAELSAVRVRTEQVNKLDTDKFTKAASRSLKIFVSNASKEMTDVKVKYFFFGRDAKGKDVVVVDQGEKPVQIKPLATEMLETPTAKATFLDAHADKGKKVEASGVKFVGHAVQIFQSEKIVAEVYEPASMKEQVGKAGPAPQPEVKK